MTTEREALIATLRKAAEMNGSFHQQADWQRIAQRKAADMLEADAQEIKHLKSTALLDGIAYSMRVAERDKARTDVQQVAVPQGWQLVPVKPTKAMAKAGARCKRYDKYNADEFMPDAVYHAMLAAAPQPPQQALLQQAHDALESLAEYEHEEYTEALRKWGEGNPHRWQHLGERARETTVLMDKLRKAIEAPEPVCPSCQAPGLMYECIACGVGNYPKDMK